MKPSEILQKARDLLAEKGWCQKASARGSNGVELSFDDENAASFCSFGAVAKAGLPPVAETLRSGYYPNYDQARLYLARSVDAGLFPLMTVIGWNDQTGRTKEEVLEMFDKAINLAISEGK